MSGLLLCSECSSSYAVAGGVPRLNVGLDGLEQVAGAFDFQWKAHHAGECEEETLYGWTEEQDWRRFCDALFLTDEDVVGRAFLDAGCGSGRLVRQIGQHNAAMVVGVDVANAVEEAFTRAKDSPNVHIVQANVAALPFRSGVFDHVWCRGVLHHTPDPAAGHRELARCVRPGGSLYVWVYPNRFNPFRFVKDVFDFLRITKLPSRWLFAISRVMAYPSLLALAVYRSVRKLPGLRARGARARRTVRTRGLREVQLTWFDALAPEHDSRHTEQEVLAWFEAVDFEELVSFAEPKVGVRGVAPTSP
jgi:SAM-dependent methyltransferase